MRETLSSYLPRSNAFFPRRLRKEKEALGNQYLIRLYSINYFITLMGKNFRGTRSKLTNLNNLFREPRNPFIQNTNDLYYDFWELSTVESLAYFLLNYNWLNHENLLSLILLIAKIYYAKLAVFRFVNRENLFRKNFRRPKFMLLRYWCLLTYWYWWLLEFLTNLIT